MQNARLIPVGSTILRAYYTIPTHYTRGDEFATWDAAVIEARERYEEMLASLRRSLGGSSAPDEEIERTAKNAVQVALRWYITYPDNKGSVDVEVERYGDVTVLRTEAETGARA